MTRVTEFLDAISDADMKAAILELKVLDEQAVLPDGVVRRLGVELADYAGIGKQEARKVLEYSLFRHAAYRWAQHS
ncbi:hypothetical protein DIE18_02920 [Burkholderia sp. Bp9125]|nr:hypothetical protein DIE18_02920 [Burkholderia sp. Bp9125]